METFQDEKLLIASTKASIIQENEMLLQELDVAREQFENLQKHQEESEAKSKADIKLLVKEVKSLRGSQSELKQELSQLMKEKIEVEVIHYFLVFIFPLLPSCLDNYWINYHH